MCIMYHKLNTLIKAPVRDTECKSKHTRGGDYEREPELSGNTGNIRYDTVSRMTKRKNKPQYLPGLESPAIYYLEHM